MGRNKRRKTPKERRVERFVIFGLIVALVVSVSGVALAGNSPPTSINTCTKVKHGNYGATKVTAGAACSGTQFFQTWSTSGTVTALQQQNAALQAQNASLAKYKQLMVDARLGPGSESYSGVNFSGLAIPPFLTQFPNLSNGTIVWNFSNANFNSSDLFNGDQTVYAGIFGYDYADFSNANFSNAFLDGSFRDDNFTGANFTNSSLTGSNFAGSNLTGVTVDNTFCPDGTYISGVGSCSGHGF